HADCSSPIGSKGARVLPATVVLTGLVVAVLARRWSLTGPRLSPAATTILAVLGAVVPGMLVMGAGDGPARPWVTVPAAVGGAVGLVLAGAVVNERWLTPLRERTGRGPTWAERLEDW